MDDCRFLVGYIDVNHHHFHLVHLVLDTLSVVMVVWSVWFITGLRRSLISRFVILSISRSAFTVGIYLSSVSGSWDSDP